MGCNTSKETVHPTDESKENNDNQIKDVSNKEEINNIDDVHNNDATINTVVNGTEELKESINAAKGKYYNTPLNINDLLLVLIIVQFEVLEYLNY